MTTTRHDITELPLEAIGSAGNVRAGDVEQGEDFEALVASIRERGVLAPVLVADATEGMEPYVLVDGHRRHAAARAAGLELIPARVVEISDEVDGQVLAMVANVRRLNLGPVEEADAYARILQAKGWTQKLLAESLGVSESHVGARLKLSRLPQGVRDRISDGTVPLASVAVVEKIADVSPAVAEYLVSEEAIADDQVPRNASTAGDALRGLSWRRAQSADGTDFGGDTPPFLYSIDRGSGARTLAGFGLSREAHPELAELADEKLPPRSYGWLQLVEDTETLRDQARAYGCLLEVDGESFVTDEAWLADRVAAALEAYTPRPSYRAATTTADDPEAVKEKKAWEREKARVEQLAAGARNRDLERVLRLALMRPDEISVDVARLVAAAAIEEVSVLRVALVFAELHTVTTTGKDDKRREKTNTKPAAEAEEWIRTWVLSPETATEVLGRAAAVQLAHHLVDERVMPPSQRPYHHDEAEPVRRAITAAPAEVDPALVTHFRERQRRILGDDEEAEGGEE